MDQGQAADGRELSPEGPDILGGTSAATDGDTMKFSIYRYDPDTDAARLSKQRLDQIRRP